MSNDIEQAGDWYCKNCGYLSAERVTYHETCDQCHIPVEWHEASDKPMSNDIERSFWRFLYLGWAYGWGERPFIWAVAPHPRWANKVSEWLYSKWMHDECDR